VPRPAAVEVTAVDDRYDQVAMNAAVEAKAILNSVWSALSDALVPVDPVRIARELGVDVFQAPLEPHVSGALVKRPGEDPQILLNRDDHANRQRFSCAHELGHFVQRAGSDEAFEYVDFRGPLASRGTDEAEIFANAFAANLLMPADEVKPRAREAESLFELAYAFRVSQEAMANRLVGLGLDVGRTRP
jgi:Zn-dependent peptidase ImmA (M78 family)